MRRRRKLAGKRVLVTGCSSGIGRELCLKLVNRGAHVLATARREDRLDQLQRQVESRGRDGSADSAGTLAVLAGDICDPTFRISLIAFCQTRWQGLDILVNNAGVGGIGLFSDADDDRLRLIMEVDFFSAVDLTRLALPLLRQGDKPAILNVGSVLSHRSTPLKSEYCAAKFALRGWSEALRVELMREGIDVLMLSPSTTKSEFFDSLVATDPGQKSASIGSMSTDDVADAAVKVLVHSKRDLVLTVGGKFLVWAGRLIPGLTDRLLARFGMPSVDARS